jgi:hypothetical protein
MANLYFRYSEIYESMLASVAGEELSIDKINEGYDFVKDYINHWEKYNDIVFKCFVDFGFVVPDFWIAYFIHSRKGMTPFSDPLTLFIKKDLDELTSTLIHELSHVMLSYGPNFKLEQELWNHLQKTYPNNDFLCNIEIMTIILTRAILKKVFGPEKTDELLSIEKSYDSLKIAWQTIDSQSDVLSEENPVQAIFKLK